jgi:iron(III) transport system substrate-binding protein
MGRPGVTGGQPGTGRIHPGRTHPGHARDDTSRAPPPPGEIPGAIRGDAASATLPGMRIWALVVALLCLSVASCSESDEVVLYTSVDEPVARSVIDLFEVRSGIRVRMVTDTEATKTAGLAERVAAERDRPRADVYWGNEPFHTIHLAEQGVLASYVPPGVSEVPDRYRDPRGFWTGAGYRIRVLVRSARSEDSILLKDTTTLESLTAPALRNRIGICLPTVGTTAGHMAALYVAWGEEKYRAWLIALRANNVKLLGGNSIVAQMVGNGALVAGVTDNDDVTASIENRMPVEGLPPDQADGQVGTLVIPTTVALVACGPNPDNARKLIDFLTQRMVEDRLRRLNFVAGSLRDLDRSGIKAIDVDLRKASVNMRTATELALTILQDRPTPQKPGQGTTP